MYARMGKSAWVRSYSTDELNDFNELRKLVMSQF
jgi:hypothetical protein